MARLLQSQYEALLAEPITDDEVRSLLERLGTAEFGGPEVSRVGDLIEATDADTQLVARLLGEIRHEDYQERFGARLDAVERRLSDVERRTAPKPRPEAKPPQPVRMESPPIQRADPARRRRFVHAMIVLSGFLGVVLVDIVASAPRFTPSVAPGRTTYVGPLRFVTLRNGDLMVDDNGTGRLRPASPSERAIHASHEKRAREIAEALVKGR